MVKVRVIASTIRYEHKGEPVYRHAGEEFHMNEELAKEKAESGLVKIISKPAKAKEEKAETATKELKDEVKTK